MVDVSFNQISYQLFRAFLHLVAALSFPCISPILDFPLLYTSHSLQPKPAICILAFCTIPVPASVISSAYHLLIEDQAHLRKVRFLGPSCGDSILSKQ